VREKLWLSLADPVEPGPCLAGPVSQSFELVHSPSVKMLIDALCEEAQLGAVEGPVS
jgi:hypothetical protein